MYPEAIEHGIKEEENAKFYYSKLNEKKHCSFYLEETGLQISSSYSWIEASLDGIRKCQCCKPTVEEIKCPFKGKDFDPKIAFLLPTVGGKNDKNGNVFLDKNHLHYFQVQTGMAVAGLKLVILLSIQVKGYLLLQLLLMISFGQLL